MPPISVGTPLGPGCSTCGYCGPPGGRSETETSYKKSGLIASQLTCAVYQKMIDRGWRRSGTYCYAPDLRRSCCPQYTIKLDILAFKPSRSQRKLVNRWNRFIRHGHNDGVRESKARPHASSTFCLVSSIHESDRALVSANEEFQHDFRVTLEHSSYTDEKYALYVAYQTEIHHDNDNSPISFRRFLVQSPLLREPILYSSNPPEHLPTYYGSYHQMYRLDGELIAMGVIDILPGCVSSVYFMYNARWEKYSLGKLSALREAALALEIRGAGVPTMTSLYMGFYIHSCQKMRYKGEYCPSFLADPEEYTWHPLKTCIEILDKYRYATFAHPEHSLEGSDDPGEGVYTYSSNLLAAEVKSIFSIQSNVISVGPITMTQHWGDGYTRQEITSCIRALGAELSRDIIFRM
ncbi:arginine-tRNA-protein transferase [Phlebopus sp. FC_14]|nr:arginine-tRNA-protein transferase [Phlebopus sp. FC_14]